MKRFVLISVMSTLLPESSWRMVTTLFSTTGVCSTACSCLNTVHITSISASCKVCKIILILSQIIRNTMTRGKHAQTNLLVTHMNTSPDLIRDIPAVPRHLEKTTVLDRLGRVGRVGRMGWGRGRGGWGSYWHECAAFQLVGVWAADWQ